MKTFKIVTGIALSAALLTGSLTASFATVQAAAAQATTAGSTTITAKPATNQTQIIIGKIKSISNGKLVIYKSSTQPDIPAGTEGTTVPKAGEAPPSGQAPTPPAEGEAKANAGGQPPAMTFSSSTTTLTTTSATTVVSVTRTANAAKATETKKKLSSLKAGDIVFITLASGSTSQISKIELMTAQPAAKATASSK